MKLRDYLHFEEISVKDFAKSIDYSPAHVSAYINKRMRFGPKAAKAIEAITNGKVSYKDIIAGNRPKKSERESKNILQNTGK